MDTVKVHIFVKDEPAPRQFVLSGAEFTAMKDAVKAAGGRYDGDRRSWALPGPGAFNLLKGLRQQCTVEEVAILRLKHDFDAVYDDVARDSGRHALDWRTAGWTVNTSLLLEVQIGQDQIGNGAWRKLPPVPAFIEIAPVVAAGHAEKMLTPGSHWETAQVHGISIARCIVQDELNRRAGAANVRLVELLRGQTRTKEAIFEAVKALLVELGLNPTNA